MLRKVIVNITSNNINNNKKIFKNSYCIVNQIKNFDSTVMGEEKNVIKEGKAEILVHDKKVFYNPVQEFNRDLSIAVLTTYAHSLQKEQPNNEGLRILEALSASGLRSIRYAKEIPHVREIVANDFSSKAVESIEKNIIHNNVQNIVTSSLEDAVIVMYRNKKTRFDVVDLDPYGCPSTFLDAGVQCVKDNGILLVTATDMAVLAGNSPETCFVKYGAVSLKSKSCHEIALRILLQNIAAHAGRHGRVIEPLLSISADFYIRVFVKVTTSPVNCKRNLGKLAMIYQCVGCNSLTPQPLGPDLDEKSNKLPHGPVLEKNCQHCGQEHVMGGPIWTGSLHNDKFVEEILDQIESEGVNNIKNLGTVKRIQGILHLVAEELEMPLYYELPKLVSVVRCVVPPMPTFRSAILNAGYKVSYSHANKASIKTDAPNQVLWDIIRAWEKKNPINKEKHRDNKVLMAILDKKSTIDVCFQNHPDAVPYSRSQKLTRFQLNPQAHWGPGTKSVMRTDTKNTVVKPKKNKRKNSCDEMVKKQKIIDKVSTQENEIV